MSTKKKIFALLLFLSTTAEAVSDFEGNRAGVSVSYQDGTMAEVLCDRNFFCKVHVKNSSGAWTLQHQDIPGLIVLPSQLSVVLAPENGKFVIEVEVTCAEYSPVPPPEICLAQVTVQDSVVTKTVVFKRQLIDQQGPFAEAPTDR